MLGKDVVSAFNMLKREGVLKALKKANAPPHITDYTQGFLAQKSFDIQWDNVTRGRGSIQRGTPQGSPLPPVLWLCYIARTLKRAEEIIEFKIPERFRQPRLAGRYGPVPKHHTYLFSYADDVNPLVTTYNIPK